MTSVVGILNKQAIALAADSAITFSGINGNRIYNKANKLFTVSKHHPVAVMIYNSAGFMGTPWETIIKVYRKQLGRTSFPTLKGYYENFISFLRSKNFYSTIEEQKQHLQLFSNTILDSVVREVVQKNDEKVKNPTEENKRIILQEIEERVSQYITAFDNGENICEDFADYTQDSFQVFTEEIIEELISQNFVQYEYNASEELIEKIRRLLYLYVRTKEDVITNFTGLIFAGFGEEEIYPSLVPVNISLAVENRLRYYVQEGYGATITNSRPGAVCPFAQTDVIDTILTGVDPTLEETFYNNFTSILQKYNQVILTALGDSNEELSAQISSLDLAPLITQYQELNAETKRSKYINPLFAAVSNLSKEDLAEMAESLIYTTYLKRRITNAEESVGGPVDVAVLSKGDGFIWIKRKHYFKPELNRHFFDNYLTQ